jgi:hypothetical protein
MPRRSSGGGRSSGGMGKSGGFSSRSHSTSRSPGYSSNSGYRSSASSQSYRSPYTSNPSSTPARPGLGGMGMGSAIATGMALGGGSALGHHIVGGMLGGHGHPVTAGQDPYMPQQQYAGESRPAVTQEEAIQEQIKSNPCFEFNTKFVECIRENSQDISRCQNIFNDLTSCEKSLI